VLVQLADGCDLAVLVLHRYFDRHRSHSALVGEDRDRSVAAAPYPDRLGRRLPLPAMSSVRLVPSGKERGSTLPLPSFKSNHDGRELGFVSSVRARLGSLSRQFALAVAIMVTPVLVGLIVIVLLMVVSGHDMLI